MSREDYKYRDGYPFRIPLYWEGAGSGYSRADGLRITISHIVPKGIEMLSVAGWCVIFPVSQRLADFGVRSSLPLESASLIDALREVDRRWPPPGWLDLPDWWLCDLELLAGVLPGSE